VAGRVVTPRTEVAFVVVVRIVEIPVSTAGVTTGAAARVATAVVRATVDVTAVAVESADDWAAATGAV
jgi:hypothetical protein